MTFDEWLNEIENFSPRIERLEAEVDFASVMTGNMSHNLARRRMYDWLEAAYKVGYEAGATEKFPPEAEGDFGIATEAQFGSWQKKLNRRFGIGSGELVSLEEPEGGK